MPSLPAIMLLTACLLESHGFPRCRFCHGFSCTCAACLLSRVIPGSPHRPPHGVAPSASAPRPPGRRRASARRRRPPPPRRRTPPAAVVVPDLSRFQVRGAKEVGSKVTFMITGTVKQYEVATFSLVNNLGRRSVGAVHSRPRRRVGRTAPVAGWLVPYAQGDWLAVVGGDWGAAWSMLEVFTYKSSLFVSLVNCIICGRIKLNYAPILVFGDKILAVFTLPDCLLVICSFVTLSIVNGSSDSSGRMGLVFILFNCAIIDR